jgi:argininosuccinate lyase
MDDTHSKDAPGNNAHSNTAPDKNAQEGQVMWGGRFAATPDQIMQQINASIDVDQRLWRQDIAGSKAHATMLGAVGVLSGADVTAIHGGLDAIAAEIEAGTFPFSIELEDIHLNIEARLTERIGDAGKRLHTGRSRNDQVATDFRLWVKAAVDGADDAVEALIRALLVRAGEHTATIMPGFTHLQTAQPVTLGHHLMAYVEMFSRDRARLIDCIAHIDECPLGAAALAGTPYPVDRHMTATALGFRAPTRNSMDSVGSRDFAMEALNALAICAVHLSRLAEELVLWTSPQFGFARMSDQWSTGSSIMPQKRNPDAAELIRAKAARIAGNAQSLMMIVKALPLTYAKDLQDDKALTFEAFDAFNLSVAAMRGMIETIAFDPAAMRRAATLGYSTATDLADWLVRALNMPFREAHHVTGAVVKRAEVLGVAELCDLPLAEAQAIEPRITAEALAALSVEASVAARTSYGGTAPAPGRGTGGRGHGAVGEPVSRIRV